MAKYKNSGLVSGISGSAGDYTFFNSRGVPMVKKRVRKEKQPNTWRQKRVQQTVAKLLNEWSKLSFTHWALWEEYAKKFKVKFKKRQGLIPVTGARTGITAYVSVNSLLILCGFDPMEKPPLANLPKPHLPETDLMDLGVYKNKLEFDVWLPSQYITDCVAQIWIRRIGKRSYPYVRTLAPLSTSKTRVVIDKLRIKENNELIEKDLKDIGDFKVLIQMRTIANNGRYSQSSQIYRIEVKKD